MSEQQQEKALFAVVELFGHAKIAGKVSEHTFGGAAFVRVDVPEVRYRETDYDAEPVDGVRPKVERHIQAHTRSFGAGAIYSINWCDELGAVAAAHSIKHQPINPFSVREAFKNMPSDHANRLLPMELDAEEEIG